MKFKLNLLATAAVLALSSVSSFAAINVTTNPSLLFVARDGSGLTAKTYVRNIGSLSSISGSADTLFNAPVSSIFGTQLSGVAANQIYWNVFALDNSTPNIYLTGGASQQASSGAGSSGAFGVGDIAGILTGGLGGITQLDLAVNGYAQANGEYTGSSTGSDQTNALQLMQNFSGSAVTSGQGVGSSQNFLKVDGSAAGDGAVTQLFTNSALSAFNGNAKGGYFTLLDAAGNLKWTATASVAAVPLPAAAFLFGPGLLAMFGAARRRKAA
jgi:hypothetical protein